MPDGDTGNGVDDDAVGGVARTVLPGGGAGSAPEVAPRSQAARASAARASGTARKVDDGSLVMRSAWQRGCPPARSTPFDVLPLLGQGG